MSNNISDQIIPYTVFQRGWSVILYNDLHHSMLEVINALHEATGLSKEECTYLALMAHQYGFCVVYYTGDKAESLQAEFICNTLRKSSQLQCEVFYQE